MCGSVLMYTYMVISFAADARSIDGTGLADMKTKPLTYFTIQIFDLFKQTTRVLPLSPIRPFRNCADWRASAILKAVI